VLAKDYEALSADTVDGKITVLPKWKWGRAAESKRDHFCLACVEQVLGHGRTARVSVLAAVCSRGRTELQYRLLKVMIACATGAQRAG
jgi:hypothetical protein